MIIIPKVSIIIPVYNAEQYLIKCLDSIINQSLSNLEIILVNDGSSDSSPKIIDDYATKDNRIVVIHKDNGGIGSAYKAAFEVMTGDYVLFVDSDDWVELNAVGNLVKLALDNEADMVSVGIRAFNPMGEEINLPFLKNIDLINSTNEAILKTHFEVLKHPTLVRLFKRSLFNDIIVFEQNIGIDEMLTPQLLAKCNRAVYTSVVYYNVFLRENSISRIEYDALKIEQTLSVYNFLIDFSYKSLKEYQSYYLFKYLTFLRKIYVFCLINKKNYRNQFVLELFFLYVNIYKKSKSTPFFKKNNIIRISVFNPYLNRAFPKFVNLFFN